MSKLTDHIAEEFLEYTKKLYNNDQGIKISFLEQRIFPDVEFFIYYIFTTDEDVNITMFMDIDERKESETAMLRFRQISKTAFSVEPLSVGEQVLLQV